MPRIRAAAGLREIQGLLALPPPVRRFYLRALFIALRVRDKGSLRAAIRPASLRALLRLADECMSVAELGTGTGWASIALVLADPDRVVTTYDIREGLHRHRYVALLDRPTRERIVFELRAAEDGPAMPTEVDLLYVDVGFHAKELTVDSFRAWEASVVPDGLVVFHDYGEWWPGVREAVEELGLEGTAKAGLFVWRKDALPS
jgi:hypothetical protein